MNFEKTFRADDKDFKLKDCKTDFTGDYKNKAEAEKELLEDVEKLSEMQDKLYAQDRHSVLIVFQALDAAGKDSTIKHVMSGVNPQGCDVRSFKAPSSEELNHDFLWRTNKALPERGRIGIFNRSYYEEVLVTKVHPEIVVGQRIPGIKSVEDIDKGFWKNRYKNIANYEDYLSQNGVCVIKFFLHLSKDEQKKRFLKRIDEKDKNWKVSPSDMKERVFWDDYQKAYEDAITNTSTKENPWYVIPADNKWFMRLAVSKIINSRLEKLGVEYPTVSKEVEESLQEIKKELEKN